MDNQMFREGMLLESIFWPNGETTNVGKRGCMEIIVVMENGQMAGVPWALVTFDDKRIYKYNLATVEGVALMT